jgi:N-acyl amino acid synthase of PEP-CTERM/exosortase system
MDARDDNPAPYFRAQPDSADRGGDMLRSAFQLRFQVYCVEYGFLPARDYPNGWETDAYDDGAAHFFCHNLRDELVGYVRLVSADEHGDLPWRHYATQLLDGVRLPPVETSAEISRLMVRREYRRRRGDTLSGVTLDDDTEPAAFAGGERRNESPQVLLSLYRQMYQHSVRVGIRYWYAAMERPLARALRRMHFAFRQVSPETDYFGPVAAYVADLRELEHDLGRHAPPLLAWFQRPDREYSA